MEPERTESEGVPLGRRELLAGAGGLVGMAAASSVFAASHVRRGRGGYGEARATKEHPEIVAAIDGCLRHRS